MRWVTAAKYGPEKTSGGQFHFNSATFSGARGSAIF